MVERINRPEYIKRLIECKDKGRRKDRYGEPGACARLFFSPFSTIIE
jgi:hypothetical protein